MDHCVRDIHAQTDRMAFSKTVPSNGAR